VRTSDSIITLLKQQKEVQDCLIWKWCLRPVQVGCIMNGLKNERWVFSAAKQQRLHAHETKMPLP